jgi:alginate O-acetyltransferase complex protein AlgI
VAAIFGSTPVLKQMVCKLEQKENGKRIIWWLRPMFLLLLLVICTAYLVDSSFNPFLYFRF